MTRYEPRKGKELMLAGGKGDVRYRRLHKNLFDLRRCAVVHNLHVLARSQSLQAHLQETADFSTGSLAELVDNILGFTTRQRYPPLVDQIHLASPLWMGQR